MNEQDQSPAAISAPSIPGIDLGFRPRSYFGPMSLDRHVLAHMNGEMRRRLVRSYRAEGRSIPAELAQGVLEEHDRAAWGRIHPRMMGGEYLPPFLPGEIEIARISLESTTFDQISVRARPEPGKGIAYRIVDEYGGEGVEILTAIPEFSTMPLTLGELACLIDGASEGGGAAMGWLIYNAQSGLDPESARSFVTVSSEFYPDLERYYRARSDAWLDAVT